MVIAVLADDPLKQEFLLKETPGTSRLVWVDSIRSLGIIEADVYMDLLFEYDHERVAHLKRLLPKPVFVNSVTYTLRDIRQPFTRINAWPTMLGRNTTELVIPAGAEPEIRAVFDALGWGYTLVPDIKGMITPRIVAAIINEAYFTLGDGISTKSEIDKAMKLGTNYPFGPFEWAEKIGIERVKSLLLHLGASDPRYSIAPALTKER